MVKPYRLGIVLAAVGAVVTSVVLMAQVNLPPIRPTTPSPGATTGTSRPASTATAPTTGAATRLAPAGSPLAIGPALSPRKTSEAIKMPDQLPSATGYGVEDAFPNQVNQFQEPVCMASPPGDKDKLFVLEKRGKIQVLTGLTTPNIKKSMILDINAYLEQNKLGRLSTDNEWGLLGLAFHPEYAKNGFFYIFYCFNVNESGRINNFCRLSRFTMNPTTGAVDLKSEVPYITQYDRAQNHNGGDVHFGPDGYLYFSAGDEGDQGDRFENGKFIDRGFFAGIYRIDVDNKPANLAPNPYPQDSKLYPDAVKAGTYKVPADNPFVKTTEYDGRQLDPKKVRTEKYALGFRNPWRFCFDPDNGRLLVGDVGDGALEEIDLVQPGGHYGWSYKEGTRGRGGNPRVKLIDPIYEYGRGGEFGGASVTGGRVYAGTRLPELHGAYIFGDYVSRRVWALRLVGNKWVPQSLADNVGGVSAFGINPVDGDVLIADLGGKIKRLARRGMTGTNPPALLSQTGAFTNLGAALTPSPALVPYNVNVPFWSDNALKTRWFIIPKADDKIEFSKDANWKFPTGMVWVKHFELETKRGDPSSRKRIETRFLVKTQQGVYGITYKWRPSQNEADLVPESGLTEQIPVMVAGVSKPQTWRYPSRTECNMCHTDIAGGALGFGTAQLNGDGIYGGKTVNTIQAMSDAGYFDQPAGDVKTLPAFYKADDKTKPLEARVRSYLAVNCVQCHQTGSQAAGTWDARHTMPLQQTNIVGGNLVAEMGDPLNRVIAPGDPAHSMMIRRIQTIGVGRMPPLATSEIDTANVELLTEWVKSLPKR